MNDCERYRSMVSELLDGELTEPQKTELEAHMAACRECARLYDAFAFISFSIDEGLAEPPESLRTGVMNDVRDRSERLTSAKKRSRVWGRLAALAACLAVAIFAASRSGDIFPQRTSSSEPEVNQILDAAAAPALASGDVQGKLPESGGKTQDNGTDSIWSTEEDASITAAPFADGEGICAITSGDQEEEGAPQDAPEYAADVEKDARLMGISSVSVFSGDSSEPDPEPITTVTDEDAIVAIMDMLEFSEAGDDISVTGAPIFIFDVERKDGSSYSLSVWIVDGRICCVSDIDGVLYIAAGDAGDFFDFIAGA